MAWATALALGELLDDGEPGDAAARLFDALHLREPMADAFGRLGFEDEDRWRAAARVRAVCANQAWLPGAKRSARSPHTWLHDPDVAWLINVHEYQGVRYFNKEMYECLLWWMALPALVHVAESPVVSREEIRNLEMQLRSRIDAADAAGYQIMALFELGENRPESKPVPDATSDSSSMISEEQEEPVKKGIV